MGGIVFIILCALCAKAIKSALTPLPKQHKLTRAEKKKLKQEEQQRFYRLCMVQEDKPVVYEDETETTESPWYCGERLDTLREQAKALRDELCYYDELIATDTSETNKRKYFKERNRIFKELDSIFNKMDKLNK